MAIVFELTAKEAVSDIKEFCRLKDGLTYIGKFADKKTSMVILGEIIQYGDAFYTTELPYNSGFSFAPADTEGMVTTTISLYKCSEYAPEKCKPVSDCQIRINIWDIAIDDEGPICSYAFYGDQLAEAKKVVKSLEDVEIFFDGEEISREEFLEK